MFQPVIPASGFLGLQVLRGTYDRQFEAFSNSAEIQRNVDYFRENAGSFLTAEDLVNDRRALEVTLGAFGLGSEIDKKALIQKLIEEGTSDPEALANRFADTRFREFVDGVGYLEGAGFNFVIEEKREEIIDRYTLLQFEEAVGAVDDDIRLALNFEREIQEIAGRDSSDETKWLLALGSGPIRSVLDTAFNLPSQFAQIDIDQQVEVYREKAQDLFGADTADIFQDPANVETVVRRFMALQAANAGPSALTPGAGAVTLLSGAGGLGAASQINLILSNAG
ncbi:MAG: DUF1217 domain-containing protein [Pseudomonadota bacterium]